MSALPIDLTDFHCDEDARLILEGLSKGHELESKAFAAATTLVLNGSVWGVLEPGDMTRYMLVITEIQKENHDRPSYVISLPNFGTSYETDHFKSIDSPFDVYGKLTENYASATVLAYFLHRIGRFL